MEGLTQFTPEKIVRSQSDVVDGASFEFSQSPVFGKVQQKKPSKGEPVTRGNDSKRTRCIDNLESVHKVKKSLPQREHLQKHQKREVLKKLVDRRERKRTRVDSSGSEEESFESRTLVDLESDESDCELHAYFDIKPASNHKSDRHGSSSDIDEDELDHLIMSKAVSGRKATVLPSVRENGNHEVGEAGVCDSRRKETRLHVRQKWLDGVISSDSEIDSDEEFLKTLSCVTEKNNHSQKLNERNRCEGQDFVERRSVAKADRSSKGRSEKSNTDQKETSQNSLGSPNRDSGLSAVKKSSIDLQRSCVKSEGILLQTEKNQNNLKNHKFSFMKGKSQQNIYDNLAVHSSSNHGSADSTSLLLKQADPYSSHRHYYRNSEVSPNTKQDLSEQTIKSPKQRVNKYSFYGHGSPHKKNRSSSDLKNVNKSETRRVSPSGHGNGQKRSAQNERESRTCIDLTSPQEKKQIPKSQSHTGFITASQHYANSVCGTSSSFSGAKPNGSSRHKSNNKNQKDCASVKKPSSSPIVHVSKNSTQVNESWLDQEFTHAVKRTKKKTPPKAKSNHFPADGATDSPDPVVAVQQVESDEALARRLQEEMDQEYAASLAQSSSHQGELQGLDTVNSYQPDVAHLSFVNQQSPVHPSAQVLSRQPSPWSQHNNSYNAEMRAVEAEQRRLHEVVQRYMQFSNSPEVDWFNIFSGLNTPPRRRRNPNSRNTRARDPLLDELYNLIGTQGDAPARGRRARRGRGVRVQHFGFGNEADGNDYEELLRLSEQLGDVKKKGLTNTQIDCLPTRSFSTSSVKPGESAPECHVCMCEYEDGDQVRILTCFHEFHVNCIDKWLKENATCPVCRVEVSLA